MAFTLQKTGEGYPSLLTQCTDAPEIIYGEGAAEALGESSVSIVGSRVMTGYGKQMVARLVPMLVRAGLAIVSGLAYGIDVEAHRVALEAGGKCVAVLGGGVTPLYPARHAGLAQEIENTGGCIISEYPAGTIPQKRYFPARNRIIAGLSMVTIIIEAGPTSGTLSTGRWALDYGRTVCVVPGDVTREQSLGVLQLLRQGAVPIASAEEVLALYNMEVPRVIAEQLRPALTGSPATLYDCISRGLTTVEAIINTTGWTIARIQSALSVLELDGYIVYKDRQWLKTS